MENVYNYIFIDVTNKEINIEEGNLKGLNIIYFLIENINLLSKKKL